jgi:hypothetical protein
MNIVLRGVWFPLEVEPKPSHKATPTYTYIQPHTLQHTQANPGMRDSCAQARSPRTRTPRIHARTHALIHSPIHTRIHTYIHIYICLDPRTASGGPACRGSGGRRGVPRSSRMEGGHAAYRGQGADGGVQRFNRCSQRGRVNDDYDYQADIWLTILILPDCYHDGPDPCRSYRRGMPFTECYRRS